jgi:hypothetical protein
VTAYLEWAWTTLEAFMFNPLTFGLIVIGSGTLFIQGVRGMERADAARAAAAEAAAEARAKEAKDAAEAAVIGIEKRLGDIIEGKLSLVTRISRHHEMRALIEKKQKLLDGATSHEERWGHLLDGPGEIRTHWAANSGLETIINDMRLARDCGEVWVSTARHHPLKNDIHSGMPKIDQSPDWLHATKNDLGDLRREIEIFRTHMKGLQADLKKIRI